MTQQAGDTRLQQHHLGLWLAISPCSFQKNISRGSAQIQLLLAPVQVCSSLSQGSCTENRVKAPAPASDQESSNDLSVGLSLCGKLGPRHKDPAARGLAAGTSRSVKHPAFRQQSSFFKMKELAIHLFIFFKRRSSPGDFYPAYPILWSSFKETPTGAPCSSFSVAGRRESSLSGPISFGMQFVTDNELLKCRCCSPPLSWSSAECSSWPRE